MIGGVLILQFLLGVTPIANSFPIRLFQRQTLHARPPLPLFGFKFKPQPPPTPPPPPQRKDKEAAALVGTTLYKAVNMTLGLVEISADVFRKASSATSPTSAASEPPVAPTTTVVELAVAEEASAAALAADERMAFFKGKKTVVSAADDSTPAAAPAAAPAASAATPAADDSTPESRGYWKVSEMVDASPARPKPAKSLSSPPPPPSSPPLPSPLPPPPSPDLEFLKTFTKGINSIKFERGIPTETLAGAAVVGGVAGAITLKSLAAASLSAFALTAAALTPSSSGEVVRVIGGLAANSAKEIVSLDVDIGPMKRLLTSLCTSLGTSLVTIGKKSLETIKAEEERQQIKREVEAKFKVEQIEQNAEEEKQRIEEEEQLAQAYSQLKEARDSLAKLSQ